MIGAVARCRQGKIGVICSIDVDKVDNQKRVLYRGISFNGTSWQSMSPDILAPCVYDYLELIKKKEVVEAIA